MNAMTLELRKYAKLYYRVHQFPCLHNPAALVQIQRQLQRLQGGFSHHGNHLNHDFFNSLIFDTKLLDECPY
jgi:hypothetical protein